MLLTTLVCSLSAMLGASQRSLGTPTTSLLWSTLYLTSSSGAGVFLFLNTRIRYMYLFSLASALCVAFLLCLN